MRKLSQTELVAAGLVSTTNITTLNFAQIVESNDVQVYPYSRFMSAAWEEAGSRGIASGALFELLVAACFYDAKVSIFYRHATLMECPKIETDLLVWSHEAVPWCIQMTSTLRERYKLADLQAFRLKAAFPKAVFVLLTMDQVDAAKRSPGDFESLDELIYCGSPSFDLLIERLTFARPRDCNRLAASKRTKAISQLL